MKKNVISVIVLTIVVNTIFAQTYSPVKTPKCSDVDAYIRSELSPAWITTYNADAAAQYPNATFLANSSTTYNSHGYAWHKSDGGSTRWIGYYSTTEEDEYWGDGSYVEVGTPVPAPYTAPYATKVSYTSDDHSAVTTSTTGVLISKWGSWPLMQHAWNYSPYNHSNLKYYTVPISGSDVVCSSSSFQSISPSSGTTTYSWSVGTYLNPTSGATTNNFSASENGNGSSYVNVQINSSCSNTTVFARKPIWVGTALIQDISYPSSMVAPDELIPLSITTPPISSSGYYKAEINRKFGGYSHTSYGNVIEFSLPVTGTYDVKVYASNVCGWSENYYPLVFFCTEGEGMFAVYPNPAFETISIENQSSENGYASNGLSSTISYQFYELNSNKVVLEGLLTNNPTIDVSGLRKGRYILKIQVDSDKEETHKIIIN